MSLWIIQYTYDTRSQLRESLRDEHSSYLRGLANAGAMLGFGPFADDEPGALLLASAPTRDHVEDLVAGDPYMVVGMVIDVSIRAWDGHLGPSWRAQAPAGSDS